MPEPYCRLNFAIIGESHGVGIGPVGFAGAAGAAGFAAGVPAAPAAGAFAVGAAGAAFGGAGGATCFGEVVDGGGPCSEEGSEEVFVSD